MHTLRFVYEDFSSSYEDPLQKSGLPSLHIRRMRIMAIEVFLFRKGLVHIILDIPIFCRYLQWKPVFLVRGHSYRRHLCYGTHFQMILDNVPIFNQFKGLILSWNGKFCNCVDCNSKWVSLAQVRLFSVCFVFTFNFCCYVFFSFLLFC